MRTDAHRPPLATTRPDRGPATGRTGAALRIAMALAAWTACTPPPPAEPPPLAARPIEIRDLSLPDAAACPVVPATMLALAAPGRTMGDASPRLRVAAGCARDGAVLDVRVALSLELAAPGTPIETFDGMAMAACDAGSGNDGDAAGSEGDAADGPPTGPVDPFRTLACATAAVDAALDVALARWRLAHGGDDALADALGRAATLDRQVLLTAIERAGDRRLRTAAPALVELLGHPDPDVVMRAIGSLGRLGDPVALPALGTLAVSPRPEVWDAALQAIADIGGPRAERALELVAGQAVSPVVIRRANELLDAARDAPRRGRP